MQLAAYVHPFDLEAMRVDGGLQRLVDLGIHELSLATSYHDGRWLVPWHPLKRVRFLEDGTLHFRPKQLEPFGALQPKTSSQIQPGLPSPLETLCGEAAGLGLRVRAWTVFGHNSRLGAQHLDACVENAHGDRYPYALCPSQSSVQRHHVAMVRELAAHDGLQTIELEALGQMGIQHSSHHDKKSFEPKGLLGFALSSCFCSACLEVHARLGQDGDAVRSRVRAIVDGVVTSGDAMAPAAVPMGPAELDDAQRAATEAVLAVRRTVAGELAAAVVGASGKLARAVQVHPDPWFTGSQLAVAAAASFPAPDERVLTCYGQSPDQIQSLLQHGGMVGVGSSPRRLCIWPKAPQFASDQDLAKTRDLCAQHRIASLAIYHLGLLPWRTIERVCRMVQA
ncbi:MAG: hypothetical protein AB8H80_20650 [Planctomycetota bacterium]